LKEALVFVGYLEEVFSECKKFDEYEIILIAEKYPEAKADIKLDKVYIVSDYTCKECISEVIDKIKKEFKIRSIYANVEWAVNVCGYIRDKYSIEGLDENTAILTRDKYKMKQRFHEGGINTAEVSLLQEKEDARKFSEKYSFPVIVKPRNGSATVNTFLINNEEELNDYLEKIDNQLGKYIIESFNPGEEYHCDSIVVNGEVCFSSVGKYYTNCIDTINTEKPVAAVIFPDTSNNPIVDKIKELNKKVIKVLGIKTSVCHLEVFENNGDLVVGEIASRLGGGPLIGRAIESAYGINMYKKFIELGLSEDVDIDISKNQYSGYVAFPYKKGVIRKISKAEDFDEIKLDTILINYKEGDVISQNRNTACRTGYAIVHGDSFEEVKDELLQIYTSFDLTMEEPKINLYSIF
jgi:carbamoylphosphate synthase large subunit